MFRELFPLFTKYEKTWDLLSAVPTRFPKLATKGPLEPGKVT